MNPRHKASNDHKRDLPLIASLASTCSMSLQQFVTAEEKSGPTAAQSTARNIWLIRERERFLCTSFNSVQT